MKKLILTFALFGITFLTKAQVFEQGGKNANIGLTTGYGLGVFASVDYGYTDVISLGVSGSFSSKNYGSILNDFRVNYLTINARGAAHLGKFIKSDNLDLYVGVSPGYRNVSIKNEYSSYYGGADGGVYLGLFAGGRYKLNDKLTFYVEGGTPISSLGLSFKF